MIDIEKAREWAAQDRFSLKRHSLLRMFQRSITVDEVKEALQNCEEIEEYPTDRPLPSSLVLGYTLQKRPLHLVIALEQKEKLVWVITTYEPDPTVWKTGFTERK